VDPRHPHSFQSAPGGSPRGPQTENPTAMSEKRKRQAAIRFRVSEEENDLIRANARVAEIPVASFARDAVIAVATGKFATSTEKSRATALRTIVSEINRIAVVTKKRSITQDDATRVVDELRRLQLLLFRFYYEDRS